MISKFLEERLTKDQKELLDWSSRSTTALKIALDNSVVDNSYTIGLPHFSEKNPQLVKDFTWLMAKLGFGTSKVLRNFSNFTFNVKLLDEADILAYRARMKLDAMLMTHDDTEYSPTLVRRPSGVQNNGVPRPGMAASSKLPFEIDRKTLAKYRRPIKQNLVKSIRKGIERGNISAKYFTDDASYTEIIDLALDYYINTNRRYNSEGNVQDQRGRAVKRILKRIGNYIASKDFRALLVVPSEYAFHMKATDTEYLNEVYLFIAELTGHKCIGGVVADKIEAGRQAYLSRELPRLDLSTDHGRKDLHEYIWLNRIYTKLAQVFSRFNTTGVLWNIPIEIDHGMSMGQIEGALTNEKRLLEATSVIGSTLNDPWFIEGVPRLVAKMSTAIFYGSSASLKALAKHHDLHPTTNELKALTKELSQGKFAIMKQFKDLLIQNYNVHTPVVHIDTGVSLFQVEVNHFKPAGATTVVTEAWNGSKFKYSFTKKPILVPDYKRMKLFWATGLIHHLDSDLREYSLVEHVIKQKAWVLDIHDADLCLPNISASIKRTSAKRLKHYNTNRNLIMNSYMTSIGAVSPKANYQYIKLLKAVQPADDVEFNTTLMK